MLTDVSLFVIYFDQLLWCKHLPMKLMLFLLFQALSRSNYGSEPMLRNCGISINSGFTEVEGRVLQAPRVNFLMVL